MFSPVTNIVYHNNVFSPSYMLSQKYLLSRPTLYILTFIRQIINNARDGKDEKFPFCFPAGASPIVHMDKATLCNYLNTD